MQRDVGRWTLWRGPGACGGHAVLEPHGRVLLGRPAGLTRVLRERQKLAARHPDLDAPPELHIGLVLSQVWGGLRTIGIDDPGALATGRGAARRITAPSPLARDPMITELEDEVGSKWATCRPGAYCSTVRPLLSTIFPAGTRNYVITPTVSPWTVSEGVRALQSDEYTDESLPFLGHICGIRDPATEQSEHVLTSTSPSIEQGRRGCVRPYGLKQKRMKSSAPRWSSGTSPPDRTPR